MDKNPELLRKAMATILKTPENHDQCTWISKKYDEEGGICGTTMCLAGYVAFEAGAELPKIDPEWDGEWHVNSEGKYRTEDQYIESCWDRNKEKVVPIHVWAGEKLGLDYEEREYLFYYFGNAESLAQRVDDVASAWENGQTFYGDDD